MTRNYKQEIKESMPEIKGMIWGKKPRARHKAMRLVEMIQREVSGWKRYELTWSKVSAEIEWRKPRSRGEFKQTDGSGWSLGLRCDAFWTAVGEIVVWYVKQTDRYRKSKTE